MKKILIAAMVTAAFALPTGLQAQSVGEQTQWGEFNNRGQCQAELMRLRNEFRHSEANTTFSSSELNAYNHEHFSCERKDNGKYAIFFA